MEDKLQDESNTILQQIDQQRGDQPEEAVPEKDTERLESEPEPAITETIHVYFVRESTWEEPANEQVIESTLAASEAIPLASSDADNAIPEAHRQRSILGYCTSVFGVVLVLSCLVFQLLLVFLTPTPTIALIPVARDLTTTATITAVSSIPTGGQIPGRLLPQLTLTQTKTAPATGKDHQDAHYATGTITFYNGLLTPQTVAAGTRLSGADGVQVVTDQVAVVPAALATTPPTYGQAAVFAHATQTGPQGNIPVRDINQACCLPSVLAQNTVVFQGGQSARDYNIVTKADRDHVVTSLTATLTQSAHAALAAQLAPGEALVTPTCTPTVTADHQPGQEATAVRVAVAEWCTAAVYESAALQDETTQMLTQQATHLLGTHYGLIGAIQVNVVQATLTTDQKRGIATVAVRVEGIWMYQFSQDELQQIKHLVAGNTAQEAEHRLLRVAGIQRAIIEGIGEKQRLPKEIASIHLRLLYGVV